MELHGLKGYLRMESNEMLGHPGLILHCVHLLYMPLLELGQQRRCAIWMESTEKLSYPGWNSHCSHLHLLFPLSYLQMESIKEMESRLKSRTAYMDWICICCRYCHSSFHNDIWSFYNIIQCHFYRSELYSYFFLFETPFPKNTWEYPNSETVGKSSCGQIESCRGNLQS